MALSTKKRKAIAELLTGKSIAQASKDTPVALRTLHRWLAEDAEFRAELHKEQEAITGERRRLLLNQQRAAILELAEIMEKGKRESDRRLAAVALLSLADSAQENEFMDRLKQLENQVISGVRQP